MDKVTAKIKGWMRLGDRGDALESQTGQAGNFRTEVFSQARDFKLQDVHMSVAGRDFYHSQNIQHIYQTANNITVNINEALRRLPNPVGSSWEPSQACLPGTRVLHLEEISSWIHGPSSSAEAFIVASSAGSGKTAIANTVCQEAHKDGHLVASFFFKQTKGQSTSRHMMAAIIHGLCAINDQVRCHVGEALFKDITLSSAPIDRQFEEIILPACKYLPHNRPFVVTIDGLDEARDPLLLNLIRDCISLIPLPFRFLFTTRPEKSIMQHLANKPHIRYSSYSLVGGDNRPDLRHYIESRLSATDYGVKIPLKLLEDFVVKTEGLFLWAATVLNHLDQSFEPFEELRSIVYTSSHHWGEDVDGTRKLDDLYSTILSKQKWTDTAFVAAYRRVMGSIVTLREPLSSHGLALLYEPDGLALSMIENLCKSLQPLLQNYDPKDPQKPIHLLHLSVREFLTKRAPLPYRLETAENHTKLSLLSLLLIKNNITRHTMPFLGYTEGQWDIHSIPNIPTIAKDAIPEPIWYALRFVVDHTLEVGPGNTEASHLTLLRDVMFCNPRPLLEATAAIGSVVDLPRARKWLESAGPNTLDESSLRSLAKALSDIASCLEDGKHGGEGLPAAQEAVSVLGQIASSDPDPSIQRDLALSLRVASKSLVARQRYPDALRCIEDAVTLTRQSAPMNLAAFRLPLVQFLRWQGKVLITLERPDDAVRVCGEALRMCRDISTENTVIPKVELAYTLFAQAWNLSECQRHSEGVELLAEAVATFRGLVLEDAPAFLEHLTNALYNHASYLTDMDRHEEALGPIEEALSVYRELAENIPGEFDGVLAATLHQRAITLGQLERYSDVSVPILEAIAIRERLYAKDPTSDDVARQLADSYHECALNLSYIGAGEECLYYSQQAVRLWREIASLSKNPDAYHSELSSSLLTLGSGLASCERYDDAILVTGESISMRRQLALRNPKEIEPLLALSLFNHSWYLSQVGQDQKAIEPAQEAAEIQYRLAVLDPATHNGDLALSLHHLAQCLHSLGRFDDAIAAMSQAIRIRRAQVVDDSSAFDVAYRLADSLQLYALYMEERGQEELSTGSLRQEALMLLRGLVEADPKFEEVLSDFIKSYPSIAVIM
ncbi:TPR-like protein [Coprinopsis marcescibilis]|uniref:TPR-like protein n=1 Tax=Coprinopsis marcescibilis TaxID=230819 RepID=A0A5C3KBU9_COPMA|nr:TPR-like protein [Coprinopsis marcescibilis]